MAEEKTTLSFVTEIGTFGSMNIKDPTVIPVNEAGELVNDKSLDPALRQFLKENQNKK